MPYVKNDPVWVAGLAPGISAERLAHMETQYDEAAADLIAKSVLTTAGDIIYATGASTPARLGIGTARQVLQTNSAANAPQWAASPQSVLTAQADLLYASAANVLARLAKGTASQVLRMNVGATAPEWETPTSAATASALARRDAAGRLAVVDGSAAGDAVTKGQLDLKLNLAGGTMSGETNFADQLATRPKLKDYSETAVVANTGTTYTIDLTSGNVFELTLTGNCVFTFSNPPASGSGGSFTLILKQDGTGSRTTTWPASVKWVGGTAPTLTATASGIDILAFVTTTAGTVWYGFLGGLAFATPA